MADEDLTREPEEPVEDEDFTPLERPAEQFGADDDSDVDQGTADESDTGDPQ